MRTDLQPSVPDDALLVLDALGKLDTELVGLYLGRHTAEVSQLSVSGSGAEQAFQPLLFTLSMRHSELTKNFPDSYLERPHLKKSPLPLIGSIKLKLVTSRRNDCRPKC